LNFLEQNFELEPLTERDKNANNFNHLILEIPRDDIIPIPKKFIYNGHSTTFRTKETDSEFFHNLIENHLLHIVTKIANIMDETNDVLYKGINKIINIFNL